MAVATATAVAAIGAASALGSSAMQSRAAGRAARGQQKSTAGAMRMEREREGRAQQHYQAQMEQYNRNQEWRRGIVNSILQGRGINVPGAAAAGVPGAAGGGRATPDSAKMTLSGLLGGSGAGASTGAGMFDSQGGGLPAPQNMAGALAPTAPTQPTVPQGGSLTDLSGWNDWRNHGLR